MFIPQTALGRRGSGGVGKGPEFSPVDPLRSVSLNFFVQVADLVRFTSLPSIQTGRSHNFSV